MSQIGQYKILIREAHVDSLGHMNNATYLALFEEARWDLITKNGYGFAEIQKERKGPVILDVNLKFLNEIHLRETITIQTEVLDYVGKVGHLRQVMTKDSGKIAAEAVMAFGFFDLKTRRLIEPIPAWKKALGIES